MLTFRIQLVLIGLILSIKVIGQCSNESDWYERISVLPSGVAWASGQNPIFAHSPDGSSYYSVIEYYNSNEIKVEDTTFQSSTCNGSGRGFLILRHSINGEMQWLSNVCFSFLGDVDGVTIDEAGALYIGGNFNGELHYNGIQIGVSSNSSYFLMKIGVDGQLEWSEKGENSAAVGTTWTGEGLLLFLAVTDSILFNGITFYNQSGNISPNRDFVVLMVDEHANIIWNKIITGIGNLTVYTVSCNDERCIVQGRFQDEIIYDGQTMTESGFTIYQLAFKISDGLRFWMNKYETTSSFGILPNDSEIIADSLIATVGVFHENINFDSFSIYESAFGSDGYILLQNVNQGSVIWLNKFGGGREDAVQAVEASSSADGIIIGGMYASPTINYQGTEFNNSQSEVYEPFILELDLQGKPKCIVNEFGLSSHDQVVQTIVYGDQMLVAIGYRDSTAFGNFSVSAIGFNDLAIWKTCLPCDTINSIPETTTPTAQIYPNPFTGQTTIQLSQALQNGTLQLHDALGRLVKQEAVQGQQFTLQQSSLPAGLYFLSLYEQEQKLGTWRVAIAE